MTEVTRKKPSLTRRFIIMLVLVGLLLGGLVGFNLFKNKMIRQFMENQTEPAATVTAERGRLEDWPNSVQAIGTLRAVRAVDLSPEVSGTIRQLALKPGRRVAVNDVLVELNADVERAQLQNLEAARDLAKLTLDRDLKQGAIEAVSKAQIEADQADLNGKSAQVDAQVALLRKKTLLAPFSGEIAINTAAPGQYVNPGDKLANLQDLSQLVVDFSIPQNETALLKRGSVVELSVDSLPNVRLQGRVTARNASVDAATRNLQIEATVDNPRGRLLPGMFARVTLLTGTTVRYLTLPQTAVAYNPYGSVVFVVEEKAGGEDKHAAPAATPAPAPAATPPDAARTDQAGTTGKVELHVREVIVKTGPTRGDQVAIISGIPEQALVVTSGQLKLKNGTPVVLDPRAQPKADPNPHPVDQ